MSAQPLAMSITHILTNDKGQTYFVKITAENPGRLVRELWESIGGKYHGCPQTDEDACGEWTDRKSAAALVRLRFPSLGGS